MDSFPCGRLAIVIAIAFLSIDANAQSEYERAQIVVQRNLSMTSMLQAYFPLLAIKNGKSSDLAAASVSAQSIKEDMIMALTLFPEGTAQGEAPGSRARPEIWSEADKFRVAADALIATSEKLADVAGSGDIEAFKAQFLLVESACLACHEFKPSGGGKFRFPAH